MTDRGEATRQRLMEATRAVVRESGYARATTRAIAQAADVTEGTIYRHFPDKTALFFAAAIGRHEHVCSAGAVSPLGVVSIGSRWSRSRSEPPAASTLLLRRAPLGDQGISHCQRGKPTEVSIGRP